MRSIRWRWTLISGNSTMPRSSPPPARIIAPAPASTGVRMAPTARGAKIACPVLVLWGRHYLSPRAGSPLAVWRRWADDAREVALDCGHFIAEEAPEDCAAALASFFAGSRL